MKVCLAALLLLTMVAGCQSQSVPETAQAPASEALAPEAEIASAEAEAVAIATDSPTEVQSTVASEAASPVKVQVLSYDEIQKLVASHKGKVVVMDAWSTSCPPCIEEFPNLVALHKKYGPDKIACISLSFDYEGLGKPADVVPMVQEFLQKQGATFDNVVSSDDSETLYKKMELASVPAVYVYDKQGQLAKRFDNEMIKSEEDAFNYEHVGKLVAELVDAK